MTAKERILGSVLGVLWAGGFAAVWQVAAPAYSLENKERIFLCYLAVGIVLLLWWIREAKGRRMSLIEFLLCGGSMGLIAGLVVYGMFAIAEKSTANQPKEARAQLADAAIPKPNGEPPKKEDRSVFVLLKSAGQVPVAMSPLPPDPSRKLAHPEDLDFYFFALMHGAFDDKYQYATATITNRTAQKMHLELWYQVYYWSDAGEPMGVASRAEWNPDGVKQGTGEEFIDLDGFETKQGRILISLGKPDSKVRHWFLNASKDVYIEVFDTVTGKRAAFRPWMGYPGGQVPTPLPSPKFFGPLLAAQFPQSNSQDLPSLESLELLARTRVFGYDNGSKFSLDSQITNLSEDRMELAIDLLVLTGGQWRPFKGVVTSNEKDAPTTTTLKLVPDKMTKSHLTFDLAEIGSTNTENHVSESPKDTLLQIREMVSGKTVWCAIDPGYPPGRDMRPILNPPPPKTEPISPNAPTDAPKDTK